MKGDSNCQRCKLYKTAKPVCLMGQGPTPCFSLIVGEAPGAREDDINKPFSGECGQILDEVFSEIDWNRRNTYITNVIHCRPPENRKPRKSECTACQYWLQKEVEEVKPRFILLLGATALGAFPKIKARGNVGKIHGQFYTEDGITYMATFHPGAVIRNGRNNEENPKRKHFDSDLKKFFRIVKLGGFPKIQGLNFRIMKNKGDLLTILEDLKKEKTVSFDLETSQLSPFWSSDSKVVVMGLGLKDKQWIIPFNHPESCFQDEANHKIIAEVIAEALKGKTIIGQNGKFDSLWMLVKYGVDIWIDHDTMLMQHLRDENTLNGLKFQSAFYFGAPDYDITEEEKTGHCELSRIAEYCATDVFYTRRLYLLHIKELEKDPALYRFYKKVIMPLVMVYRDIEAEGVFINESQLQDAEDYLKEEAAKVLIELDKYKKNINWNSPIQLAKYLYDELKLRQINGRSTAEATLKQLAKKHKVPGLVLKYKENAGLVSKFTKSWKDKIVNHRLHPSFKLNGTVTGRPSCADPNLQQVPREKRIRSLITAPEGWVLVEGDLSQAELKVAAMLSGDRAMKLAFQTGQDIHAKTAGLISGKDPKKMTKEELKDWRKKAKPVNFGFLYGMGVETFLDYARDKYDVEFTWDEGEEFRDAFFREYSGLEPWYEKQHRIARMNGYVRNLAGRIRHLPHIHSSDNRLRSYAERQSVNTVVQGLVSDILLMAVIEIANSFSRNCLRVVGTIHDAVLMIVKKEYLEEFLPQIKAIIENPKLLQELNINMTIPLTTELAVGPWGDSKTWEAVK